MAFIAKLGLLCLCSLLILPAGSHAAGDPPESARAGVGLQVVATVTGELVVLGLLPKSPAEKAGIKPGDLIVEVDKTKLRGTRFDEVARKYLWGKEGSSVTLTCLRPGVAGKKVIKLTRSAIQNNQEPPPGVIMLEPGAAGATGKHPGAKE